MGGEERKRRGGRGKGGEGKGERMWKGSESGLPRGPCWLSAGLGEGEEKRERKGRAIKTPLLNGLATGLTTPLPIMMMMQLCILRAIKN